MTQRALEGVLPEGVDGACDQVGDEGGGELGVARTGSGCTPSEVLYTEQEIIALKIYTTE